MPRALAFRPPTLTYAELGVAFEPKGGANAEAAFRERCGWPENPDHHLDLGIALGRQGRQAETACARRIRLSPSDSVAWGAGVGPGPPGALRGVEAAYREALRREPDGAAFTRAWAWVSTSRTRGGEPRSAGGELNRLWRAWADLGSSERLGGTLGRRDISLRPFGSSRSGSDRTGAWALLDLRLDAEAEAALQALRLRRRRGATSIFGPLEKQGKARRVAAYREALRIRPEHAEAHAQLAAVLEARPNG
jgi:hypothetical protein